MKIEWRPSYFDPMPVMPDPRVLISTPSSAEILAEAKALAVEVLGQEEADKLHAEAEAAVSARHATEQP
jgi:hypothetical protein